MTMCTKALLGDPLLHHYDAKPNYHWSAVESINNVIKTHKNYWKSLKFQIALPSENVLEEPLPSRGLEITDDINTTCEENLSKGLSSTLDDSKSSRASKSMSELNSSLEGQMACLSFTKPKCDDGIHCGTDEEDDVKNDSNVDSKKPSQEKVAGCSKLEAGSSKVSEQGGCSSESTDKKTLVDYLAENMQAIVDGDMFAVIPLPHCPHLESLYAIPSDVKFEQGVKCIDCDHTVENWVCLHCYIVSLTFY